MSKATLTVNPPSGNNGTGWVDIDVSATPLAGVQPGDALTMNPVDKNANITSFGLALLFVSAPDVVSVGVKLLSAPIDVLVATVP